MNYKMIESNLEVILYKIWLFAESWEDKDIRKFKEDIIELIKKAEVEN